MEEQGFKAGTDAMEKQHITWRIRGIRRKKKQQKAKEMFHKLPFAVMEPWKKWASQGRQG
jgi:hypothetical protein